MGDTENWEYAIGVTGEREAIAAFERVGRAASGAMSGGVNTGALNPSKSAAESAAVFQQAFARANQLKLELAAIGSEGVVNVNRVSAATSKWGAATGMLATSFASASRDVDTLGGKTSSVFARAANDVLGVASAMASPLTAAVALASFVGGALLNAWAASDKAAEDAIKARAEEQKQLKESIDGTTRFILEQNKAWDDQRLASEFARIKAMEQIIGMKAVADQAIKLSERRVMSSKEMLAAEVAARERAADIARLTAEKDAALAAYYAARKVRNDQEAREANAANSAAAADALRAEEKETTDRFARENEERIRVLENYRADKSAIEKRASDEEEQVERDRLAFLALERRTQAQFDREDAAEDERKERSLEKLRDAEERHNEKLAEKARLQEENRRKTEEAMTAQLVASVVTTQFGIAMDVASRSVSFMTSELSQFQNINRENYRDLLVINENTIASFAKRAQAFLFNLAIEAAGKAAFETGAGIGEYATGFALAVTPGAQGMAAGHFISGATHFASAAAYGAISGGAGAGWATIGALTGAGGPISATTKEDKERADRERTTREGPASGRAGRGGGSTGPVVVNINYEPGAYGSDDARAARSTARAVRNANRDWFARREMRG